MKIGFFGDGPWSHNAILHLVNDPIFEIAFICVRFKNPDTKLIEFAREKRIQLYIEKEVNSKEFLDKLKKMKLDLIVSMSFDQIFKKEIIGLPKFGSINCHAGKLPFYRGRNILNWALINDEKEFGITVHYVDEGIDTGDIIKQKCYPIIDSDDYNSLLQISYFECAAILYDAIKEIQANSSQRILQSTIHPVGFYCGKRGLGDEIINWNQTSRNIFNFIRSICKPGPMATTYFKELEIRINKAKMIHEAPNYIGTPGQLLAKTKDGFLVKTTDSFLEILEIESSVKLKVGDKL